MTFDEKSLGRAVLAGTTGTIILRILGDLYRSMTELDVMALLPISIGIVISGCVLWALWSGHKWARYLLGYGHLVIGLFGAGLRVVSLLDGKATNPVLIPVNIWYAIIGALLLWAPGVSSYMSVRRNA